MQRVELEPAVRVLVVEDDADDAAAVARFAANCGIHVSLAVARDGEAALELLACGGPAAAVPEVVLLDIGLPAMDGLELLRRVKATAALQDIPVILLTGSENEKQIREGQRMGAHTYIAKPISRRDFAWIVSSCRRYRRPASALRNLEMREGTDTCYKP